METQIKSFYNTPQGIKFVTVFGYATKGVPSLEINGVSKLSKNIKEKLIFMTRTRKLTVPSRRFVICVEMNELEEKHTHMLKWLEFPLLLMYWYLAGLLPIAKLEDCITSGYLSSSGEIFHLRPPHDFLNIIRTQIDEDTIKNLRYIGNNEPSLNSLWQIESKLLLEHIPNLKFN